MQNRAGSNLELQEWLVTLPAEWYGMLLNACAVFVKYRTTTTNQQQNEIKAWAMSTFFGCTVCRNLADLIEYWLSLQPLHLYKIYSLCCCCGHQIGLIYFIQYFQSIFLCNAFGRPTGVFHGRFIWYLNGILEFCICLVMTICSTYLHLK